MCYNTSSDDDGIRCGKHTAFGVDSLTGIRSLVRLDQVGDGQGTTPIHTGCPHTGTLRYIAPIETPYDEGGGDAHGLAHNGETASYLHLHIGGRGYYDGGSSWGGGQRKTDM